MRASAADPQFSTAIRKAAKVESEALITGTVATPADFSTVSIWALIPSMMTASWVRLGVVLTVTWCGPRIPLTPSVSV